MTKHLRWAPLPTPSSQFQGRAPKPPANEDDVGFDLEVSRNVMVPPRAIVPVHHDIAVAPPIGVWLMLVGRSSALARMGLHVMTGIVDPGYRGELLTTVYNFNDLPLDLHTGSRISQLIPMSSIKLSLLEAEQLDDTERGEGGYGSTGQ